MLVMYVVPNMNEKTEEKKNKKKDENRKERKTRENYVKEIHSRKEIRKNRDKTILPPSPQVSNLSFLMDFKFAFI
jgi:hypothetical protein